MRRLSRADRRHLYIDPVPQYYGWDGEWRYFGRPGFGGGRDNGGSFGPCWTRTPIGPIRKLRVIGRRGQGTLSTTSDTATSAALKASRSSAGIQYSRCERPPASCKLYFAGRSRDLKARPKAEARWEISVVRDLDGAVFG